MVGRAERCGGDGVLFVLLVPDLVPDKLLRRALELVVERGAVDEAGVLAPRSRRTGPSRVTSRHVGLASSSDRRRRPGRRPPRTRGASPRGRLADVSLACSFVNSSGADLCVADADELGLDAELLEQLGEVHVLHLEARVAEAARGVDDDAVGVGADVERTRAGVLPAAEHLLLRGRGARGWRRRAPRRARSESAGSARRTSVTAAMSVSSAMRHSFRRSAVCSRTPGVLSMRRETARAGGDARAACTGE